jgi:hypothetical protein
MPCDQGAGPAAPAAVDELTRFRLDVMTDNSVESAVRVAGGIPTLGGGLRMPRRAVIRGRPGAAV